MPKDGIESWLNEEFSSCFSAEEQSRICGSFYLLTSAETERYFLSKCAFDADDQYCPYWWSERWWLADELWYMGVDGKYEDGYPASTAMAIRPAVVVVFPD